MIDYQFDFFFYSRNDKSCEPISRVKASTRYQAALLFAKIKKLPLRSFLELYAISR